MLELRPYQQSAVDDIRTALVNSSMNRVICEAPTGAGKTVLFSYIVQNAEKKGNRTLILTNRTELLTGTGGTLKNFGINPVYIMAGRKYPPDGNTFVGMAQTLKNRIDKPEWLDWFRTLDLIIIDEAHLQEFNKFFQEDIFNGKTVIGFSATPKRGGKQRQLGEDYDAIVHTLTVVELIDMGFLMPDMYFGSELSPDMKGVKKDIKGDYSESDMFKKYDTPKLYGGVIEAYKEHTPNAISIVFCSNIIHCVRTCKQFNDNGIPAKFLVSKMSKPKRPDEDEPQDIEKASPEWVRYWEKIKYYEEYNEAMSMYSGERHQMIKQWKNGDFKVMINAGILTTGFDYPAIETVVLFRATISEVLYLQMLGRASRISPGTHKTHFNILDFGRNAERLGGYKMPRKWHLWHESKSGSGVPAVKECGAQGKDINGKLGCGDFILASSKMCPSCGYLYPEKKQEADVSLTLMVEQSDGSVKPVKPIDEMNFEELEAFAKIQKFKQMWVIVQVYLREGKEGLESYRKFKKYNHGWKTKIFSHIPAKVIHERMQIDKELI